MSRYIHPPRTRHRACAVGYTLVELLTVVAVIAIAAALLAPVGSDTAGTRLTSAARMLAADIDYARVASLTEDAGPLVVVFADDGRGYHLAYTDDDPDTPVTHPVDRRPYIVRFGQGAAASLAGVTIDSLDLGDDDPDASQLPFGRFGQIDLGSDDATDAEITLAVDDLTLTLTVAAASGEVHIGQLE